MNLAWTKYNPLEDSTGVSDPLAFDYFAQVLGNVVLPHFTSRTSRARYYSMVCYGIYICENYLQHQGLPVNDSNILYAYTMYEKYWSYAVVSSYNGRLMERDGNERDFRGKRGALAAAADPKITTLDDRYRLLSRQLELGSMGAYRSSLTGLGLLYDSSLRLTHRGERLAKSFINTSYHDRIILKALKQNCLLKKEGNVTLDSFGWHTRLDGFLHDDGYFHQCHNEELELLREYILNSAETFPAARLIHILPGSDSFQTVKNIASYHSENDKERYVVDGYKTILAFEELAVLINKIWCMIIDSADNQCGQTSAAECAAVCAPLIDTAINEIIPALIRSPQYNRIAESFHGSDIDDFIKRQVITKSHETFILDLLKFHTGVMSRRRAGSWLYLDSGKIVVTSGYDYAKNTKDKKYLHDFKTTNIQMLIKDCRWVP